jgi:hypothetical protein
MRQAIILVLLLLISVACENNYDPPRPYGIGQNRGSNGRAFAAQQSPTRFVIRDIAEEDTTAAVVDVATGLDIPSDLSAAILTCIADEGGEAFTPYCVCKDAALDALAEQLCWCEYVICVTNSPATAQEIQDSKAFCTSQGYLDGNCAE